MVFTAYFIIIEDWRTKASAIERKVAYDTPEMKRIGREIKRKLQKDLRGTGFEVHSNLRFRF